MLLLALCAMFIALCNNYSIIAVLSNNHINSNYAVYSINCSITVITTSSNYATFRSNIKNTNLAYFTKMELFSGLPNKIGAQLFHELPTIFLRNGPKTPQNRPNWAILGPF